MKGIRIIRKTEVVERIPTYDLTVDDAHHYILEDGIVSHNSQSFIPMSIAGGGCLAPGSLVVMADGKFKEINDIRSGDIVRTLIGDREIEHVWEFDKKTYEIEFEDGSKIQCSEDHRFFIGDDESDTFDDKNWAFAKDLVENSEIYRYTIGGG